MRQEEQLLEAFWSNEEQARKHCHVATSPRRDVTKSRRGGQLLQKSTRPHVATSPHRDVTTSRRHHVATSPRRDVTTSRRMLKILHLIIKCEEARESRALGCVRPETRNWRPATLTGGFFLYFCIGFSLFTWLFLDYMMVFFITYILFLSFMMF